MWKTITADDITTTLNKELRVSDEFAPDDLLDFWVDMYPEIKGEYGATQLVEHKKRPSDWGDYDIYVTFSMTYSIPPRHHQHTEYCLEDSLSICIVFQYPYNHFSSICIPKTKVDKIFYEYSKSIAFIYATRSTHKRLKGKLKDKIPLLGNLIADIRYSRFFSAGENFFNALETRHYALEDEFIKWFETHLTPEDMKERDAAYETFWAGIPEDQRCTFIQV